MRTRLTILAASLCTAAGLGVSPVMAQPAPEAVQPAPPAEPTPTEAAPEVDDEPLPPPIEVAPMPGPNEDFTIDSERFKVVETDPEGQIASERAEGNALAESGRPLYQRMPGLAIATEGIAGLFGAGAIGLLGGTIGEAIDPGDDGLAFGGLHGALFGSLFGSMLGAAGGVWAAGQLFEKDLNIGWALLGSALGTAVGGSIAFGIVEGIGNGRGDGAEGLGVAVLLIMQVGGAIGLTEAFIVEPEPSVGRTPIDNVPNNDVGVAPSYLIVPFMRGEW